MGTPAHLVLIIFKKAPMELRRVTIWALPVRESVTVMTGQENARNSSNVSNKCPHDLSYLYDKMSQDQMMCTYHAPWNVISLEISNICGVNL